MNKKREEEMRKEQESYNAKTDFILKAMGFRQGKWSSHFHFGITTDTETGLHQEWVRGDLLRRQWQNPSDEIW